MTRDRANQTDFSSGELDPKLLGRVDLEIYRRGAKRLRNVFVQKTGGVTRRPGTKFVAQVDGAQRLISVVSASFEFLVALTPFGGSIFLDNGDIQSLTNCPWSGEQINEIKWLQYQNDVIMVHQEFPPQVLTRDSLGNWACRSIEFFVGEDDSGNPKDNRPFARFANSLATVQPVASGLSSSAIVPAGTLVAVNASDDVFAGIEPGTIIQIKGRQLVVVSQLSGSAITASALQELVDGNATNDWKEQAFSDQHGWPRTITVFQGRLVFGGNPALPSYIWMSKIGEPFNFDEGSGLDDESIAFEIQSRFPSQILNLLSGRHLQIFTNRDEWIVTGEPVTPTSFTTNIQTSVGSYESGKTSPINIDGSTIFIGSSGRDIREFVFSEADLAYQAPDLAIMARHLIENPVAMAYDKTRELFLILNDDGTVAVALIDRSNRLVAWSVYSFVAEPIDIYSVNSDVYFLFYHNNQTFLAQFDDGSQADVLIEIQKNLAETAIENVPFENGSQVISYDRIGNVERTFVSDGTVSVSLSGSECYVGLPYKIEIVPMPPTSFRNGVNRVEVFFRPTKIQFLVDSISSLNSFSGEPAGDLCSRYFDTPYSGVIECRSLGWKRSHVDDAWKIEQDHPSEFTLLATTMHAKVS